MNLAEKFIWAELTYKLYGIAVNIQNDDYSDNQELLNDLLDVIKDLENTTP
ncbi:hypothetical protein B4102_3398 [Heyndrickxia sporothermodurans]|uniref:Uncharacterized protein n=1 Tax=Heyndrickxia sporothermodurans TaxID=46224 RepID=A0A150KTU8_9BACI|nr:hypothetical protein [Heyndrickxia sporothermodurans]KYD03480.1 hypothetical protein B4102_3398 [Heyndrickxia sporothermodurans]